MADRGIVDQAEQRTEILAQAFHQTRNLADLAEVERHEMQRAVLGPLGLGDGVGDGLGLLPRQSDHIIAGAGQLAGDAEA